MLTYCNTFHRCCSIINGLSCCCQCSSTVWVDWILDRIRLCFGPKLLDISKPVHAEGPAAPPSFMMYYLDFFTGQKTYFSIESWNSPAYILTVTTQSVMSCRCDAPLASQVTMIFRRRIRLLTPGPNIRFGGVITLWKLAGWYHSSKTPLWGGLRIHTGADSQ